MTELVTPDRVELWALTGALSLPVDFAASAQPTGKALKSAYFDLSDGTGDGFLEIQPNNELKAGDWWSRGDGGRHLFRASVLAPSIPVAWERANSFLEVAIHGLTYMAGVAAEVDTLEGLYNDDELTACLAGTRSAYRVCPSGKMVRQVVRFANAHAIGALAPSERAARALSWLHKGMTMPRAEDRFLAYYFALEAISNDIKVADDKTHNCRFCGKDTGIQKSQMDGVKHLIGTHADLPKDAFKVLTSTRAALAHGGAGTARTRARDLEPLVQSLAREGIALALKLEPASIWLSDSAVPTILPIAVAEFTPDTHAASKWGRTVRQALADYLRGRGEISQAAI